MKQLIAHYKEFGSDDKTAYKGAWVYDVIDPDEGSTSSDRIATDNDDPLWAIEYFEQLYPGIDIVIPYEDGE